MRHFSYPLIRAGSIHRRCGARDLADRGDDAGVCAGVRRTRSGGDVRACASCGAHRCRARADAVSRAAGVAPAEVVPAASCVAIRDARRGRSWGRHWRGRCDGGAAVAVLVRHLDSGAHRDDRTPLGGRHPARAFDRLLESVAQVLALGKRALGRAGADRSALGPREFLALPLPLQDLGLAPQARQVDGVI